MPRSSARRWSLCLLTVAALLSLAAAGLHSGVRAGTEAEAAKDNRAAYQSKVAAYYSYKFGAGSPFLPSNATTDTGQFLEPNSFPTAAYCGHCHQAAAAQWHESAHANSNRAPWYPQCAVAEG